MPKIIENLEKRLIEEAIKQIKEQGYGAVTIRSIANACGVGVGTVYNYFSSKNDLLAAHMLQNWNLCINEVKTVSSNIEDVLKCMHSQICGFVASYEDIFQDPEAKEGYGASYSRNHGILRKQLSEIIRDYYDSDFAADFVAEAMLTWSLAGKSFDEIYGILGKV